MSYMDVKTAADRWELTERRITTLCRDGRIAGVKKEAGLWLIPDDAEKPVDGRRNKFTRAMKATAKLPVRDASEKHWQWICWRPSSRSATRILPGISRTKRSGAAARSTAVSKENTRSSSSPLRILSLQHGNRPIRRSVRLLQMSICATMFC